MAVKMGDQKPKENFLKDQIRPFDRKIIKEMKWSNGTTKAFKFSFAACKQVSNTLQGMFYSIQIQMTREALAQHFGLREPKKKQYL